MRCPPTNCRSLTGQRYMPITVLLLVGRRLRAWLPPWAIRCKTRSRNELPALVKGLINVMLAVKQLNIQYAENAASTISGYKDSTQVLGMNLHSMQPGWGYVLGVQPNAGFIDKLVQKGLLSHDSTFNY